MTVKGLLTELFNAFFPLRPIPLKDFPVHFNSMSCDQDRGFSEEYEVQKLSLCVCWCLSCLSLMSSVRSV